jgi:hypothetical protein
MTGMFGGKQSLSTRKIVSRIQSGLGNRVFGYVAARRLASIWPASAGVARSENRMNKKGCN